MPTVLADDGVELSYRVQGSGPTTLLFMHGWAGSGCYFDEVIGELDLNALQVVTMDLRGHGESDQAVTPYGLDRIAADVWTVADALNATKPVIVGFSMSGKFAQYVAVGRPSRVSGLVLVAGLPASELPFPQDVARDWVSRAGDREGFRDLLGPFISGPVDAAVFDRFLDNAVKVPAVVLECTLQACISTSFADRLESLQMPTLVVGGRHDPIFTPEAVAHVARNLPCARGICLGCNHEIPMERPHELAHVIEAFVAGLGVGCRAETTAGASRSGIPAERV
jgi:pimeloyl-ACP methyl ester carboxylesterase